MNLILTILTDIITSLRLFSVLEIVAIFVCINLLSFPGISATIVGVTAKLGIMQHLKEDFSQADEEDAPAQA
jgi:hypothetical protein